MERYVVLVYFHDTWAVNVVGNDGFNTRMVAQKAADHGVRTILLDTKECRAEEFTPSGGGKG